MRKEVLLPAAVTEEMRRREKREKFIDFMTSYVIHLEMGDGRQSRIDGR
jgi:Mg2+ and Co2+ transporter CorA